MTDHCQTSGLMNEWKARKKEHCEIQPGAKTQKEEGKSRKHFSQSERQTKPNTAWQETPQRCTGGANKTHTETAQHSTHPSVLSCISSVLLLLIFKALLAAAPFCYLISGIAVLRNTTFKVPPSSQQARRACVNTREVRISVHHSHRLCPMFTSGGDRNRI